MVIHHYFYDLLKDLNVKFKWLPAYFKLNFFDILKYLQPAPSGAGLLCFDVC